MMPDIDWSAFGDQITTTCYCRCGGIFRSHAKVLYSKHGKAFSQRPCPQCGSHENIFRIASDPETYTITKDDISQSS